MYHGTNSYGGSHSHEHQFHNIAHDIEQDLNHFIIYQYCDYAEVTNTYTDDARDEVYEEYGYECEASRTTYLEYNWFVEYETGEVITYDEQPELFEELCGQLVECIAGSYIDDIGDMWLWLDESETTDNAPQYHARLTHQSSETSV